MDAIFGPENFRREITWQMKSVSGFKSKTNNWIRDHDTLLYYVKNSSRQTFNKEILPYRKEYIDKMFTKVDEQGRHYRQRSNRRYYADEGGMPASSVWTDIYSLQTITQSKQISGYPTQKPEKLLERIIKASSNEGDIVFDPFCGCATTLVVAEKLKRQWVGIDLIEQAAKEIKKRMVKLAIDRGENELAIWNGVTNRDLRKSIDSLQRTDQGKLPHPRTHAKQLYGEQEGKCGGLRGGGCGDHHRIGNLEVDHIVPKSKGGTDHPSNLQLLCGACNKMKSDKPQAYLEAQLKKQGIILH